MSTQRRQTLLPLLLLCALHAAVGVQAAATGDRSALDPDQVYTPRNGTMLAPSTALGGASLGPPVTGVASAVGCSDACHNTSSCTYFQYCGTQGGCSAGTGGGTLPFQACQLLAGDNCTVQPVVLARGGAVQVVSGFPVNPAPQAVAGFTEVPGHGIAGSDFPCPMSVLPGKCAYRRLLDGASMCVGGDSDACHAVVWYFNGTDGCSEPVAVLKREGLSPQNTFVSPGVTTLQQLDDLPAISSRLYLPDGQVVLPSEAELAAGAAAAAVSGAGLGNDTTWRGCFIGRQAFMDGIVVGMVSNVSTAEECCRSCRAMEVDGSGGVCNAFNFCNATDGCRHTDARDQTYSLARWQCELRFQPLVVPSMGWPPNLLAKGEGVPFYGGGPIAVWGPPQEGYKRYLGFGLFTYGRFDCAGSLGAVLQECVHSGSMQQLVEHCQGDPECVGFVLKPGGLHLSAPSVGIFKHATRPDKILFNPTGVLYLQQDAGSSGLSSGAIAGIAVGATAAVAVLAAAAWALVQRRRRAAQPAGSKATEGSCSNSSRHEDCEAGGGEKAHTGRQLPPVPEAQQAQQAQVTHLAKHAAWLSRKPSGGLVSPFTTSEAGAAIFGAGSGELATPAGAAAASAARARPAPAGSADSVLPLCPARSGKAPQAGSGMPRPASSHRSSFEDGSAALDPSSPAAAAAAVAPAAAGLPTAGAAAGRAASARARSPSLQPLPTPSTLGSRHGSPPAQPWLLQQQQYLQQQQQLQLQQQPSDALALQPELSGALYSAVLAAPLAELVQHVAAQDVLAVGSAGGTTSSATSDTPHVPVSEDNLPPGLREWLVDPSHVEYLRWPNGRLQELGTGASARVIRAMYNGEVIAAKEIEIERSPAMQEAFLTEALRLQSLRHPHVVSFYGVMIREARGVVLMEYAEGRDLHSALELKAAGSEQRLFGWHRRGRRVAYDVAKALNYLHAKNVVHMDVKSSNVLLTASGSAKLADVAFSRLQTGTCLSDLPLIGTFAWVAPEILLGGQGCTTAVDIYSFGVVMWEIVTGQRPKRGQLRSPRVPEECPQAVADLIDACLSQEPAERPTAQEVLHRLGGMLGADRHGGPGGRGADRRSIDRPPALPPPVPVPGRPQSTLERQQGTPSAPAQQQFGEPAGSPQQQFGALPGSPQQQFGSPPGSPPQQLGPPHPGSPQQLGPPQQEVQEQRSAPQSPQHLRPPLPLHEQLGRGS